MRRWAHTQTSDDEAIAEVLVEQARAFPERRGYAERWLERAEVRSRALQYEIAHTGERLLKKLAEPAAPSAAAAE